MEIIAKDTLHISSVGPDTIRPGQRFELNDGDAKMLIDRGLASAASGKAEQPPKNKAEGASPRNKAETAAPQNKGAKAQ